MAETSMQVQVCHALPDSSFLRTLTVPAGTTIGQAVALSGLLQEMPGIDLAVNMVGIYGKKKPLDTVLHEHDRVEVYRPLQADPKEARRRRAGNKPAKG
ncbi:persistence and stress-resistance antitoxin PasI [Janthinobacterium sp. HH107]|uniref:RnfH family protein n=1 Tax=Janthinobacterium sp. HH107 TaxID=1537279 RepID=UPI0008746026|nr:RnfH family protein [Janthinobacterium sp. HH107]OEZ97890.1 persistence and stress-resistance antitoxin PasI [Janthinobacterium sp. HH107]